jgi:hypothetical protein
VQKNSTPQETLADIGQNLTNQDKIRKRKDKHKHKVPEKGKRVVRKSNLIPCMHHSVISVKSLPISLQPHSSNQA